MGVNVVSFFGACHSLGIIDSSEGMATDYGLITRVSGSLIFVGSGTTETSKIMYDFECSMASGQAITSYGWPTGTNCKPIFRHQTLPSGIPISYNSMTGICENGGGDVGSFLRFGRGTPA